MPEPFDVTNSSSLLEQGVDCIYCHTDIVLNDRVVLCSGCNSPHHVECWQTNENRCATFGCDTTEAIRSERAATVRRTIFARRSPARSHSASPREFTLISNATQSVNSVRRFVRWARGLILLGLILIPAWGWLLTVTGPQPEAVVRRTPAPTVGAREPADPRTVTPSALFSYIMPDADFDDTTGAISGLIWIHGSDGRVEPLADAIIGLSGELDAGTGGGYSAYSRSDSPQATVEESGVFVLNRLDPGKYILILDMDVNQFIMNRPDGSGEFVVEVRAGEQTDLGVLEYEQVAYPGLGKE